MDFSRPVEALIPGAQGRVLGALARVDAELPVSTLAAVAGVGRTRASAVLGQLADLGVVSRREVGPTILVRLERRNAVGELVAGLAGLRSRVIEALRQLAAGLDPPPVSLFLFGSLARGNAGPASDIDFLAVRPEGADEVRWAASLTEFSSHARILTGNRIQVLDYELSDLRRRYTTDDDAAGALFWRSVAEDALTLVGADFREIVEGNNHATR
jgi:predicted nucleotidyltransferase